MIKKSQTIVNDARRELRVAENRRILFEVKGTSERGVGRIRNISSSGMLLETNGTYQPENHTIMSFDADLGAENYIPQFGRIVWHREEGAFKNKNVCGIRFVNTTDYIAPRLKKRIEKGVYYKQNVKQLTWIMDALLSCGILLLIGLVIYLSSQIYQKTNSSNQQLFGVSAQQSNLTQSYAHRYYATELRLQSVTEELEVTQQLYSESQGMLAEVNKDLATTTQILAETESMLALAKAQNLELSENLESTKNSKIDELERLKNEMSNAVALLQEKNINLNSELSDVQAKLKLLDDKVKYLEGNVQGLEEVKTLRDFYRDKLKDMKAKIRHFRREARLARKDALKERDRIRMALGNNGFFVKNGKAVTVDEKKYENAAPQVEAVKINIPSNTQASPESPTVNLPKNVTVDVKVFQ